MDLDKAIELEEKLFAELFETSEQIERMKKFGNKGEKEIKEEEEEEEKKEDEDTPIIPKELLEAKDKNFIVATFDLYEYFAKSKDIKRYNFTSISLNKLDDIFFLKQEMEKEYDIHL